MENKIKIAYDDKDDLYSKNNQSIIVRATHTHNIHIRTVDPFGLFNLAGVVNILVCTCVTTQFPIRSYQKI